MLQNDGEPAWQGKTYNALKDKKLLTGINKEGVFGNKKGRPNLTLPVLCQLNIDPVF
jgi:hypothetical protein